MQTQYEKLQELIQLAPSLNAWGKEFVASVAAQYADKGTLSDKQWAKISQLLEEAKTPKTSKQDAGITIGGVEGIIELFAKAKAHLKYPAIVLVAHDTAVEIKVKPAPVHGANAGFIYVYYAGHYAGKISPAGKWQPLKATDTQGFIYTMLKNLAADPAGVAAAHGKLTGKCCFCNTKLTDPKSTTVGYGPVCAKHYNLPWGVEPSTQAEITMMHKEEHKLAQNDSIEDLHAELVGVFGGDHVFTEAELVGVFGGDHVFTEAELPAEEPKPEEPKAEEPEPKTRVEFDCTPGKAVQNLMEAMHG